MTASAIERSKLSHLLSVSLCLSAFLYFQVQPLISKLILPWFGGGASIWIGTLFFFQMLLLLGYLYAHLITKVFVVRRQLCVHCTLLVLSMLFLPIVPPEAFKPLYEAYPVIQLLLLLVCSVGFPGVILAATGPLFQYWLWEFTQEQMPYRLYAVSNAGSLLGLITFPFLIDRTFGGNSQAYLWSVAYVVFILIVCLVLRALLKIADDTNHKRKRASALIYQRPQGRDYLRWVLLSCGGSLLLLSISARMTLDVAPFPLLWILPFALYLITYIVAFSFENMYCTHVVRFLTFVSLILLLCMCSTTLITVLWQQLVVLSMSLFFCCLLFHGELVRNKPVPEYLTDFYLWIACGGALGGFLVSLIAPLVFDSYWELALGAILSFLIFVYSLLIQFGQKKNLALQICFGMAACVYAMTACWFHYQSMQGLVYATRNFYGQILVVDYQREQGGRHRVLKHGYMEHGGQLLDTDEEHIPISYYSHQSALGLLFDFYRRISPYKERGLSIGAVGLGAGTVSAFVGPADTLRYYELNPEMLEVAQKYFSYLQQSPVEESFALGDARINLESEYREAGSHRYDLLVLDAFSADSIPTHLLTREAFETYWNHCKSDAAIAILFDSNYINLLPMLGALAEVTNKHMLLIYSGSNDEIGISEIGWVILTSNPLMYRDPELGSYVVHPLENASVWTDDWIDMLSVLVWTPIP